MSACGGLAAATADLIPAGLPKASVGDDAASRNGGVDQPDCADWNTRSFFETAAPEDVTACLIAGAHPNVGDEFAKTPLHLAAALNENAAVAEALIAAGADPNARDKLGTTPLHDVLRVAQNVEVLIAAGVPVGTRDQSGRTPLHSIAGRMVWEDNVNVVETLIAHDADIEALDGDGNTPLHLAASSGSQYAVAAVGALLNAGAGIDAPNGDGNTPLHLAATVQRRPAANVIALLDAGADALRENAEGQTPGDLGSDNEALKDSHAYRRLNDARFEAQPDTR